MNYMVEFYIDNKYYSSISEDINKIHTFCQKYLSEKNTDSAIQLLLEQQQNGKFPNLIYFIKDKNFISIEEFKNGLHKR